VLHALSELGEEPASQISVDERTNALLVRADPEAMARVKALVAELDHAR
jgi:type II secretory pathway component GspD/PulD (secretin)